MRNLRTYCMIYYRREFKNKCHASNEDTNTQIHSEAAISACGRRVIGQVDFFPFRSKSHWPSRIAGFPWSYFSGRWDPSADDKEGQFELSMFLALQKFVYGYKKFPKDPRYSHLLTVVYILSKSRFSPLYFDSSSCWESNAASTSDAVCTLLNHQVHCFIMHSNLRSNIASPAHNPGDLCCRLFCALKLTRPRGDACSFVDRAAVGIAVTLRQSLRRAWSLRGCEQLEKR